MGIKLDIFDGDVPRFPLEIKVTLRCDGGTMFCMESGFRHSEGFIGCYREAMRAGWKDTNRDGHRVFFGPCCSHKVPVEMTEEVLKDGAN